MLTLSWHNPSRVVLFAGVGTEKHDLLSGGSTDLAGNFSQGRGRDVYGAGDLSLTSRRDGAMFLVEKETSRTLCPRKKFMRRLLLSFVEALEEDAAFSATAVPSDDEAVAKGF